MKHSAKRKYAQKMWVNNLEQLGRLNSLVEKAAKESADADEKRWTERRGDEKAKYFARFSEKRSAEKYWAEEEARRAEERARESEVTVTVWDKKRENSVHGAFKDVVAHFAPRSIGAISWRLGPAYYDGGANRLLLKLSRREGVELEIESPEGTWADGILHQLRALLQGDPPWYRFVVYAPWLEVAALLPIVAVTAFCLRLTQERDPDVKVAIVMAASLAFTMVVPFGVMPLRERIPRFETYAIGEAPRSTGVITGIGYGVSLAVSLLLGLAPLTP